MSRRCRPHERAIVVAVAVMIAAVFASVVIVATSTAIHILVRSGASWEHLPDMTLLFNLSCNLW